MPPAMQAKLLRVAPGARGAAGRARTGAAPVDVRVLAATNRDLTAEVRAARFRQDLYYRLRVIEIQVPPLRERREDILPLARTFLATTARAHGPQGDRLHAGGGRSSCCATTWPGNVRELENAVERAVVLAHAAAGSTSTTCRRRSASRCPARPRRARSGRSPRSSATTSPRRCAPSAAIATRAAAELGIGSATLYRKLKQYGESRA